MTSMIPAAFYAPLKSPIHPAPSGDRTMARLLMKALAQASFRLHLASELRTFDREGDPPEQERLKQHSEAAAQDLVRLYRARPDSERPRLWFTYHLYYKAPDWIGPQVSQTLGIPYVVAEGSRAGKRAAGPWALAHRGAEAALDEARTIFAMTPHDREALERARKPGQDVIDLPPFIDLETWHSPPQRRDQVKTPRLLTVAMMRQGDKLASYTLLAQALAKLGHLSWVLDIVGDGPARGAVEQLFAPLASRVRFHGQVDDPGLLSSFYAAADLFAWPAVNEAYGMVLLEAQACGCPVVAGSFGGVPSVVRHGQTGLLTAPGDATAFADAVAQVIGESDLRQRLGSAARRFVAEERSLTATAERLRAQLMPLVAVPA